MSDQNLEDVENNPIPLDMQTPFTEAGAVIGQMADVWSEIFQGLRESTGKGPENDEDYYMNNIFKKMFEDDEFSGEKAEKDFDELVENNVAEAASFAILHTSIIATAYAVQALKEASQDGGPHNINAWRHTSKAKYWSGLTFASWLMKKDQNKDYEVNRSFALKGSDARHARHREYKELAIAAYKDGKFKSKNHAASEIAGKVVPLTYQVVRDYLKNL